MATSSLKALVLIGLGVGLTVLFSVAYPQPFNGVTQIAQSPVQTQENQGQMLPITAQAKIGKEVIQLEVAKTPQQQALGLMFRTSLAPDRGMLFPFGRPRIVGFWMKNCKISLDMIFLRNGVVKGIQVNALPCQQDPCPTYGPDVPVDMVIELGGGRSQELGVKVGDRISIQLLDGSR